MGKVISFEDDELELLAELIEMHVDNSDEEDLDKKTLSFINRLYEKINGEKNAFTL